MTLVSLCQRTKLDSNLPMTKFNAHNPASDSSPKACNKVRLIYSKQKLDICTSIITCKWALIKSFFKYYQFLLIKFKERLSSIPKSINPKF